MKILTLVLNISVVNKGLNKFRKQKTNLDQLKVLQKGGILANGCVVNIASDEQVLLIAQVAIMLVERGFGDLSNHPELGHLAGVLGILLLASRRQPHGPLLSRFVSVPGDG